MSRYIAIALVALLVPAVATASPIEDFSLFGGNKIFIGPSGTLNGLIGSNGEISINSLTTTSTILGGGVVLEQAEVNTLGNIVSSTDVIVGSGDHVTGNIDSGGTVTVRTGAIVDGSIRSAGTVVVDVGATVKGNIDAGAGSGVAVTVKDGTVIGTVTHKAGTTVSLLGGTIGGNVIGIPTPPTAYTTTVIPPATSFSSGLTNISVASLTTRTLLPGTYGDVVMDSDAILRLSAGTYYFDVWNFNNNATLDLDLSGGNIALYFTGTVTLKAGFDVTGVGPGDANRIYAETLKNFNVTTEWIGTIFASGATSDINVGPHTTLTGHAWARDAVLTNQHLVVNPPVDVSEPPMLALLATGLLVLGRYLRSRR